jgi:biopolymer transport protein ExbD
MVLGPTTFGDEIATVFAPRPEKILFVKASPTLRYQDVVHVFDQVRGAGVKVTAIVPSKR